MLLYLMRVNLVYVFWAFLCSSARDKAQNTDKEKSLWHKGYDFSSLAITYSTNMVLAFRSLQMSGLKLLTWHNKTQYVNVCERALEQMGFSSSCTPKPRFNEENDFWWKGWGVPKPCPSTHLFTSPPSLKRWQWFSRSVSVG